MNIEEICEQYRIRYYTINLDGSIDVDGHVDLISKNLTELPLTFNKVTRGFNCADNQLTSLQGSPKTVGGDFCCNHNQLISLKGAPIEVGGNFYCSYNQLTDLDYSPQKVNDQFWCDHNKLTRLKGAPKAKWISYMNNPLHISEIDKLKRKHIFFTEYFTYEDYLEIATGTDDEKMLFKLKYL